MRHLFTAVLAGTALLSAAAPVAAAPVVPARAEFQCNLGFMPTKPTVGVGSIVGNAWAKCSVAPEVHHMTLTLERRDGGAWVSEEIAHSDKIPAPREVYEVKTRCMPGVWRVAATASGSLGGTPFAFTDFSMERFITAPECKR
ncbi:hypothetical protein [Nocardia sp. NPDC005745]|uniref:hypothetical protein n=1 Tax=Nocardia sp. NPDC005745 TaxID=3157061 RepID=UPI0033FCED76